MSMLIAHQEQVAATVEVVTVEFMDCHGNSWRQHEARCSVCWFAPVFDTFHYAVHAGRKHVCRVPS